MDELAGWGPASWIQELESDPSYEGQVRQLLLDLAGDVSGRSIVDLGCGEGRVMRALVEDGAAVVGCDLSLPLLTRAKETGPVVRARLPGLGWLVDAAFDGVVAVLVLEHLEDPSVLLSEAARITRPGGFLAVVRNHPLATAPGSAPVVDLQDGELLWRWGEYLGRGTTREPFGDGEVAFHHQPLGTLLNAAAGSGWILRVTHEQALHSSDDPILGLQQQIPRLLGLRFELAP